MASYEIHLTLSGEQSKVADFASTAGGSLLELELDGAGDSMHVTWDKAGAYEDVEALVRELGDVASASGIGVVRTKVEAPMLQSRLRSEPDVSYFELHVLVAVGVDELEAVKAIGHRHGARSSRRARRAGAQDGTHERYLNLRARSRDEALDVFAGLVRDLESCGIGVVKAHREKVLLDTNLDADWLPVLDQGHDGDA